MRRKIGSILNQSILERLEEWYSNEPVRRATLEEFVKAMVKAMVKECAEISYNSSKSGEDIAQDILYNFNIRPM